MKSFNHFVQEQNLNNKLAEIATLMTEKGVEPLNFLNDWFENHEPKIAVALDEAGFWDGLKQAGQQAWSGIKSGAQSFARNMNGPEVQFDKAIGTLNGLINYMNQDNTLKQWTGTHDGSMLVNQLNGMVKQLNQIKPRLPQNNPQMAQNSWNAQQQPQQQPQFSVHQPQAQTQAPTGTNP